MLLATAYVLLPFKNAEELKYLGVTLINQD
jgi:hypothetical protein